MAPPKKDAFADLFQSATATSSSSSLNSGKNSKLGLADLARSSNSAQKPARPADNWSNLDLLSPSPSSVAASNGSSSAADDPFAIFQAAPKPTPAAPVPSSGPVSHSLMDDEFTDAFVETPQPEPVRAPQFSEPEPHFSEPVREQFSESDPRDEVVAQLVDIGFSVDMANSAIDAVGLDLQACVNFIMGGGKKEPRSRASHSSTPTDDLGAKLNDLSVNFFNKASSFISKSRETVVKNLEQFHSGDSSTDSLPAWMRDQAKYKKDAVERKAGGGKYEDYGSDEDNIDQNAIKSFMEQQRLKDKERNKARMDHFKAVAKEKLAGSASPSVSPAPRPPRPEERRPRPSPPVSSSPVSSSPVNTPPASVPTPPPSRKQDADLLGLGSSRAERFKASSGDDQVYVSSRRRKPQPKARKTNTTPLNQFQQSDYDVAKEKASKSFTNGDYDDACINYTKCLNALPENHELRVIINSNLAITLIKLGNYKGARDHCDQGLSLISSDEVNDADFIINQKPIKFWYTKLVSRKAEALDLSELFPEALECYVELVSKLGVNDKKVMDAKRRVHNIVHPPPKPASKPKPVAKKAAPSNNDNLKRVQEQNKKQENKDNLKFQLHDKVQAKVFEWSNGKEDNLRTLLSTLPMILPERLNFPFLTTKKIGLPDLMLPKKVKINYMKVISAIHPDKLTVLKLDVEDEMLCQSVFITLNKSWDNFKEQNGLN